MQALSVPAASKVELLVRARHNCKLADGSATMWEHVARQLLAATLKVRVGRQGDQPSRVATLSIRFSSVQLKAPKRKAQQPSLQLWAIQAQEVHAPKGTTPILWRLLSTRPVNCAAEAIERVGWYAQRWQIEVIHKVLKSGCKVEQRQMQTAQHGADGGNVVFGDGHAAWTTRKQYVGSFIRGTDEVHNLAGSQ